MASTHHKKRDAVVRGAEQERGAEAVQKSGDRKGKAGERLPAKNIGSISARPASVAAEFLTCRAPSSRVNLKVAWEHQRVEFRSCWLDWSNQVLAVKR